LAGLPTPSASVAPAPRTITTLFSRTGIYPYLARAVYVEGMNRRRPSATK
jgi:hypothetical protein